VSFDLLAVRVWNAGEREAFRLKKESESGLRR